MELFAGKVSTNTGGRVKIEHFMSGTLVPAPEMAEAVSEGTIDMAYTHGAYHPGFIDVANIESGLPMAWCNLEQALYFWFVHGFIDLEREAYAEKNIYVITPVMEIPILLCSKEPVRTIDDMKPLKIRATKNFAAALDQFGIATVYLPAEEYYTSLATGIIDGVLAGPEFDYAMKKLNEHAPYLTDLGMISPCTSALMVNMDVWNSLPEDLQGIVEDTAKAFFCVTFHSEIMKLDRSFLGTFERQPFPASEVAKLTEAATKVWDEEAVQSERNAKGVDMLKALARETGRLE